MIDIPTIVSTFNAATGGIKSAIEIVKSVRGSPPLAPPKPELIEMAIESMTSADKALLDFKDRAFALQDENAILKKRVAELERFHAEKEGLAFRVIAHGASAYIDQTVMPPYAGTAWYCQHCLDKGVKAAFQLEKRDFHVDIYYCPACSAKIKVPNDIRAEILTTGASRNADFRGY